MDFLEKMKAVLDHIEDHLETDLDYGDLARLAACSEYHLSRMFPFLTGQSLSLYIRRRRLSRAAEELHQGVPDLLDLAVKYGYSSVDAFRRAFREVHGLSPAEAARSPASVSLYPKLTFSLRIQGAQAMKYRLVEKDHFWIVGIKKTVPIVFQGPNPEIDALWRSLPVERIPGWKALSLGDPSGIISASTNFSEGRMEEKGTLDHYIGVAAAAPRPEEAANLEVAGGTWAVFEARGPFPATLQDLWGRIYSEWLPSSLYQVRQGPEILWNEGPVTSKADFHSEIWIPVELR